MGGEAAGGDGGGGVTGIITVAAKKVGGMQRGKGLRACIRTQPKKPESSQRSQRPENG